MPSAHHPNALRWSWSLACSCLLAVGCCPAKPPADASATPPEAPAAEGSVTPEGDVPPASAERPALTAEACAAQGGTVVGDIGDGAIHQPGYVCPESGKAPLGSIAPADSGPIAVEGSVCCP